MSSAPRASLDVLRDIAAQLHGTDKTKISVELDPASLQALEVAGLPASIEGITLTFPSIEARNQLAAEYFELKYSKEFPESDLSWLRLLESISVNETGSTDKVSARLFGLLNRRFDMLGLVQSSLNQANVFQLLSMLKDGLLHVDNIPPDYLLTISKLQYPLTKDDLGHGWFFGELSQILATKGELAHELLGLLRQRMEESFADLYWSVIVAISLTQPREAAQCVMDDLQSASRAVRLAATQTAGHVIGLKGVDPGDDGKLCDAILTAMASNDIEIQDSAIEAARLSAARTNRFDNCLYDLATQGNIAAAFTLSVIYSQHWSESGRLEQLTRVVELLAVTGSQTQMNSRFIDHILFDLLSNEEYKALALNTLSRWILAAPIAGRDCSTLVNKLPQTVSMMCKDISLLSEVTTTWLGHPDRRFPDVADQLLKQYRKVIGPVLNDINLVQTIAKTSTNADLQFLVIRTLGFVSDPHSRISLITSILAMSDIDDSVLSLLSSVLIHDLAYDFPVFTREALESRLNECTPSIRQMVQDLLNQLDDDDNELLALPRRLELEPPKVLIDAFQKLRQSQINAAFKQAQSQSVFQLLTTRIPIKAGTGFFSFQFPSGQAPTDLKKIQTTVPVPRSLILDPVGWQLQRLQFVLLPKEPQ